MLEYLNPKTSFCKLLGKRFFSASTLKKVIFLIGVSLLAEFAMLATAYRFSPIFPDEWPSIKQLYDEVHLLVVSKSIGFTALLGFLVLTAWRPKLRSKIGDILSISGGTLEYVFSNAGLLGDKGICVKDSSLRILLCNSQILAPFGMSTEQVVGKRGRDLFPAYFVEKTEYIERVALATRKPQSIDLLGAGHPDLKGSYTSIRLTAIPVFYPNNDFAGMFFVTENVSDLKKAELDNFTMVSSYRRLISHLPVGVLLCEGWFTTDGRPQVRVLESNAAARLIHEEDMGQPGSTMATLLSLIDQDPVLQAGLGNIITRGEPFRHELYHPYVGKTLNCLIAGLDDGKFIWIIYDITDKNSTESQILQINDNLRRVKELQQRRLECLMQDTNMVMMTVADLLQPPLERISEVIPKLWTPQQCPITQAVNEIQSVLEKMLKYVNYSQVPLVKKLTNMDEVVADLLMTWNGGQQDVQFKVEPLPRLITSHLLCQSIFTCTLQALLPRMSKSGTIRFSFDSSLMQPLIFVAANEVDESDLLLDEAPATWEVLTWGLTANLELAQARRLAGKNGGYLMVRKVEDELQIGFIANLTSTAH